jgi:ectoine hydroxylase-related dioxygenase (phytanoyl-CoA dioxygenase family)
MATTTLERSREELWRSRGYLTGLEVFSESEIGDYRSQFDALEADRGQGKAEIGLNNLHLTHEFVWRLSTHPPVLEAIRSVLGPDVLLLGNHFFCKYPSASRGDKFVAWHQDVTYWGLEPPRAVTAWLAIDDADTGNACMRFVAGSHHYGHLTYHLSEEAENNVLNQTVKDIGMYGTEVDIELKAGEISLHSDLLLHGSGLNTSDRRRCGLTLRFCAASVRAELNWNREGVIVKGSDPTGHWADLPRPAVDNV